MLRVARTLFVVTLLPASVGLIACGGGGGPTVRDRDNNGGISGGGPIGGGGNNNTGNNNTGNNNTGGLDGGTSGGNDGGAIEPEPTPPSLSLVTAQTTGRDGEHLTVNVSGSDADEDVSAVSIELLDASGAPLALQDSDFDGFADSSRFVGSLRPTYGEANDFTATVRFDGVLGLSERIAKVRAHLLDATAAPSPPLEADITPQTIAQLGEACDPDHTIRRCGEGLGCAGDPAVCGEGSAPQIEAFEYYQRQDGLRVLVRGVDPDDDLWRVRLEFLDAAGNPVVIDLDADGEADSDAFEVDATSASADGAFFVELRPTDSFGREVQQLAARAYDSRRTESERMTARKSVPPMRRNGDRCDPRGFDQCLPGSVCFPGNPSATNTCVDKSGRRTRACNEAPVLALDRPGDARSFVGETLKVSLWDAPVECAVLDPRGRPDRAVRLNLRNGANRLTLRTNLPGTGFNTVIYLIDGCALDNAPRLGCHDNVPMGVGSELVLENVAPGVYTVVVDAWGLSGGTFELNATIE